MYTNSLASLAFAFSNLYNEFTSTFYDKIGSRWKAGEDMIEKLYTVEEVAELASVTGRTIRNYLKSGRLIGRKIGGQWRFPEAEVQRLLTGGVPELPADSNYESAAPANGAPLHEIPYENTPPVSRPSFVVAPSGMENNSALSSSAEALPIQRPPRPASYYNEPAPLPGAAEAPFQKISEILTEENINSYSNALSPTQIRSEYSPWAATPPPAPVAPPVVATPPVAPPPAPAPVTPAPPTTPTFILNANGMLVEATTGQPIVIANLGQPTPAVPVQEKQEVPVVTPVEEPALEIEKAADTTAQKETPPPQPELSDVGNRVTKYIAEVHDYSKGPQVCCVVDLHQSLAAARHTSEKLAEIAAEESEEGLLCESFVEFDERYYVARYTLFGTTTFLLRCLNLIG